VTGYAARFVADRSTVSLFEVASTERERTMRVSTGAGASWEVTLPKWYPPSVAILSGSRIAVWAATRLYLLAQGRKPIQVDLQDEIHAVYGVEHLLCVVCELAVLLYDAEATSVVDRYVAEDVLGESWWEGARLLVTSFTGPPLAFHPSPAGIGFAGSVEMPPVRDG
jgi:hypothetical protein